ncbi:hypothetical protein EWZ68_04685 [Helicobacter pylori]|nr:hypothetical protein [Helicobacter pylori]
MLLYSKTHFLKRIGGHFEITLPLQPSTKNPLTPKDRLKNHRLIKNQAFYYLIVKIPKSLYFCF